MKILTNQAAKYLILADNVGSIGTIAEDRPYIEAGYLEPRKDGRGVQITEAGKRALKNWSEARRDQ